jgi:glycosyltransferase involved in cell wall biosynthesis
MITICVIHHTGFLGGGTKSFIDILNMLKHDYRVIACIPKGSIALIRVLEQNGIGYHELNFGIPTFPYYSGCSSLVSRTVLKGILEFRHEQDFVDEITNLRPDILIFNSVVSCVSGRKFSPNIKKICFVRETFKQTIWDKIYRTILEKYFMAVCFIAEHEQNYIKLQRPITEVIPDCLDPHEIKVYTKKEACILENLDPDKFYILFMGGVDNIKGANNILKAMGYLDRDCYLIIGGYFNEQDLNWGTILSHWYSPRFVINRLKVRKYFRKQKQAMRVLYTGFRKDIATLMCACDIVVFPSNEAHQPRPGIEAGEYKKTVIISDFEATKEYFIDGYNAIVFKPHNAKDLADKINDLKINPELINILGENNYHMTRTTHNYFKTQEKLKAFLDKCISQR